MTRRRRVRERVYYNAMRHAGDYAEPYELGQRVRYAGCADKPTACARSCQ